MSVSVVDRGLISDAAIGCVKQVIGDKRLFECWRQVDQVSVNVRQ